MGVKNRGRVETQPRCKIQYPMKNRYEDEDKISKRCNTIEIFFWGLDSPLKHKKNRIS